VVPNNHSHPFLDQKPKSQRVILQHSDYVPHLVALVSKTK